MHSPNGLFIHWRNALNDRANSKRDNETLSDYYDRLREKSDREDLVMFINACFAATRQNEFYTDRFEQSVSIDFLHRYVMNNYRRIYARTIASGINDFNRAQIIANLLAGGAPADPQHRSEEGRLIANGLKRLPPNRVFKLFRELQSRRVNNRRTRAVIRRYLDSRRQPEFDAIKYSRKYRAAAAHAHLKLDPEIGSFLFDFKRRSSYETPLLDKYREAHYSASAIYELPFTVAQSLALKHKVPRKVFFEKIQHKMTASEKLRFQATAERTRGVTIEFDLSTAGLTKLAIYILSLDPTKRADRIEELESAMQRSARRAIERSPLSLGRVAAVLDRSRSSAGSRQKRNRPLAVALAASYLLREASKEFKSFWSLPIESLNESETELMVTPKGQTGLAEPILEAVQWNPDLLVIVSDGYENDPPDIAAQVVRVYQEKIAKQKMPEIIHMNPVFDSNHYSPKPLGNSFRDAPGDAPLDPIATTGLRDAEDISTMIGFARFANGTAKLDVLEDYLASLAESMTKGDN